MGNFKTMRVGKITRGAVEFDILLNISRKFELLTNTKKETRIYEFLFFERCAIDIFQEIANFFPWNYKILAVLRLEFHFLTIF